MLTCKSRLLALVFTLSHFLLPTSHLCDAAAPDAAKQVVERPLLMQVSEKNPRNSEGDFMRLRNGRLLYIYSHFVGGGWDESPAHLASRYSTDEGKTWSKSDASVLPNEGGLNVMSVSMLRLPGGKIALFYLRKNSTTECRPMMRISSDEAETWSEPTLCIEQPGYYVLNNDRAVQLKSGRILLPVCKHFQPGDKDLDWQGEVMCYLSDDAGKSWRRSRTTLKHYDSQGKRITLQEPGVVELKDGRVMMFVRSDAGSQQVAHSADGGDTWSKLKSSTMISPLTPASIERIPKTGDLLLVWNNHTNIAPKLRGKRTPLDIAISRDEGKTWGNVKTIDHDPQSAFCYTTIFFTGDDHVLLAYRLNLTTQMVRFPIDWLYQ